MLNGALDDIAHRPTMPYDAHPGPQRASPSGSLGLFQPPAAMSPAPLATQGALGARSGRARSPQRTSPLAPSPRPRHTRVHGHAAPCPNIRVAVPLCRAIAQNVSENAYPHPLSLVLSCRPRGLPLVVCMYHLCPRGPLLCVSYPRHPPLVPSCTLLHEHRAGLSANIASSHECLVSCMPMLGREPSCTAGSGSSCRRGRGCGPPGWAVPPLRPGDTGFLSEAPTIPSRGGWQCRLRRD